MGNDMDERTDPLLCAHCEEPIRDGEEAIECPTLHIECSARLVIGSLAHVLRRCSCYVPGSTENDPPHISKRRAAQAVLAVSRLAHEFYPLEKRHDD
jgi:hypothetical protein